MEQDKFAPVFELLNLTKEERYLIEPFFTNLDNSVYGITFLPPEVIGALCSRASRAKDDLRISFLKEFIKPFLEGKDDYSKSLNALIAWFTVSPSLDIWENCFCQSSRNSFTIASVSFLFI